MNVNFKLVWFEDEDSAYEAHYDEFKSIIENYDLIADIRRYRGAEFNIEVIKDADLILADYDLETENAVDIIHKSIRSNQIVIDALLYSSQYDRMVSNIQAINPLLEGVFCAKRGYENLKEKFNGLVYRIVKRAQSIENLRGLLLEYSVDFDKNISKLIGKFATEKRIEGVLNYINDKIASSNRKKVYDACAKNGKNCCVNSADSCKTCSNEGQCCYCAKADDLSLLDNYSQFERSRILNYLLKQLIDDGIIKDDENFKKFHAHYNDEIIVYRNAFAHEKSNDNKLFIQAKKEYIDIDDDFFSNIKRSIKKFIDLFNFLEDISL